MDPPHPTSRDSLPRYDYNNNNTNNNTNSNNSNIKQEWKPMLDDMKLVLQTRDERLRLLEQENNALRQQVQKYQDDRKQEDELRIQIQRLRLQVEQTDQLKRQVQQLQQQVDVASRALLGETVVQQQSSQQQQQQPFRENGNGKTPAAIRSQQLQDYDTASRRFANPFSQQQQQQQQQQQFSMVDRRNRYSPGTQIVAELATIYDIELGQHAPLSLIIDEHWDRLVEATYGSAPLPSSS